MKTFSKSDFKLARDCPAKLTWKERGYPSRDDGNPYLALLAEGGYMVEQLARLGFPEGVELAYDPRQPLEAWARTEPALSGSDGTWFEATLLAGNQLVRVDILRRSGNHFELFEVKSKSYGGDDTERAEGPFRAKNKPYGILAPWRPYLEDVTYQVHVLQQCFPGATITPHLIVVDKSRTTVVDGLPRMFEIKRGGEGEKDLEIRFTGDATAIDPMELLQVIDVSSEVDELLPDVAAFAAAQLARYSSQGVAHEQAPIGMHCGKCEYRVPTGTSPNGFRECWGLLADVSPSVLELYKFGSTKHDGVKLGDVMIRNGRIGLDEVDPAHLVKKDGSPTAASGRQLIQIRHTATGEPWYGDGLARKLKEVRYPLHFIDFETSALALPYHAAMRPYQSIGFQWSCHTIAAPGAEPVHREWLNTVDLWPSLEFVETLRATIGDTGSVLMWSPHERTILRAIHTQLVAYGRGSADLLAWLEPFTDKDHADTRLVDQHKLCETEFFHPRMAKKTSIKNVLDSVWQADPQLRDRFVRWMGTDSYEVDEGVGPYERLPQVEVGGSLLEVSEGTGAMRAYQAMLYGAERDDDDIKAAWIELLRRYCKLDTLAMVLIWDHWQRVVNGPSLRSG